MTAVQRGRVRERERREERREEKKRERIASLAAVAQQLLPEDPLTFSSLSLPLSFLNSAQPPSLSHTLRWPSPPPHRNGSARISDEHATNASAFAFPFLSTAATDCCFSLNACVCACVCVCACMCVCLRACVCVYVALVRGETEVVIRSLSLSLSLSLPSPLPSSPPAARNAH